MYVLLFNNKRVGKTYRNYENARQMARKIIRQLTPFRNKNQPDLPLSYAGIEIIRH